MRYTNTGRQVFSNAQEVEGYLLEQMGGPTSAEERAGIRLCREAHDEYRAGAGRVPDSDAGGAEEA